MKHLIVLFIRKMSPVRKVQRKIVKYIKNKNNMPRVFAEYMRDHFSTKYLIEIGLDSKICPEISFPHPRNITIGENAVIGEKCIIYNDVTIGAKSLEVAEYPHIGDRVVIYPGVRIIGGCSIGNNVIIGAGSVVNCDVADNMIVAGNPCRVIGINKNR